MKTQDHSRRLFLQKFLSAGIVVVAGGAVLGSCNSEAPKQSTTAAGDAAKTPADTAKTASAGSGDDFKCDDFTGVSKEELAKRKKLGYEEKSSDPERECVKCNLFIPKGAEKDCGGCILFKGPVNKVGSCTYWVEQVS
ncbi:hypothetical protein D3C87_1411860 [compost metagenome]